MKSRKALVKELDTVFSLFIRQRDKKCVNCGTSRSLTCGHLFSRVAHSTRWDERNCHCQCSGCNLRHEHQPDIFIRWFIRKYGLQEYELLASKYHRTHKYTNSELELLVRHYKGLLN